MQCSIYLGFLFDAGFYSSVLGQTQVTHPPQDSTRKLGDSVQFDCGISGLYAGFFEWRMYKGDSVTGTQVYSISGTSFSMNPKLPEPSRYQRVGDYGLNITGLKFTDGAPYSCQFLSDGDLTSTASLVVIGE